MLGLSNLTDPVKKSALEDFLALGWPHQKLEAWKYTSTRKLQEKNFTQDTSPAFIFSDESLVKKASVVEGKPRSAEQALTLLNDAFVSEHFVVCVPAKAQVKEVLRIKIRSAEKDHARFLKLSLQLEAFSEAEIFLEYEPAEACFINLVIDTQLAEGAKLKFSQACHGEAFHYIQHEVSQAAHSHFESLDLSLQAAWFRQALDVYLKGERSSCQLKGIYLGEAEEHVDHHLCVHHQAQHGKSAQFFRGILKDHSKAVFNGKVIVEKNAQKTDASQKNDTILLDPHAEVNAKPELEIYTDDVMCAHGATVGELSEEAIFFLTTRGIEKSAAKKILLSGFLKEVLTGFEELVAPLVDKRLQQL